MSQYKTGRMLQSLNVNLEAQIVIGGCISR